MELGWVDGIGNIWMHLYHEQLYHEQLASETRVKWTQNVHENRRKNIVSEREAYHTYSVSIIAQQCINMWGKYIPGTTLYIWRIRFLHITHCGHVRHMLEQCYFQIHVFLCQIFSSNRIDKVFSKDCVMQIKSKNQQILIFSGNVEIRWSEIPSANDWFA